MSHKLEIEFNNVGTNDPCAICGARTDPIIGPEVFLAGTGLLVCRDCTAEHDVDLYHELCRQHSLLYRAGKIDHGTPLIDAVTRLDVALRAEQA